MKVLIVDDNKALIGLIREKLEEEGFYNIRTAENGKEGYLAFLSFEPDIILTDIEMPLKNGIEMMRDIRLVQPWIKTVYMSADIYRYRSFLEEEKTKYKAKFLDKPFTCFNITELFGEN